MSDIQPIVAAFSHASTPSVVVSGDQLLTIRFANPAFCNLLGQSQEELLETGLLAPTAKLLGLLELKETALAQLTEQVIRSKAAVKRTMNPQASGTAAVGAGGYNIEIYPILEANEISCLVIQVQQFDAQAANASEAEWQSSPPVAPEQSLGMILDSLSDVLFTLDVKAEGVYRFSFANRAFQTTTGLPMEQVVGKYVHEVIPEPSLTLVLEKYREAIAKREQISWQEVSHYPAGQKTGEVSVIPMLDAEGSCFRLVGMVHDITDHKEAEAKQTRLTEDLYQHNRDLEQFTYILSHNLRAPLANALGLARHLPDIPPGTDKFKQYVSYLTSSIESLDIILKELTHILSIRDRQGVFEGEAVSFADVCMLAGEALKAELLQAGGTLKIDIDPGFRIKASHSYLYSICYNLLGNAIKYRSKDRPLAISVKAESKSDKGSAIYFSDNGSGIDLAKAGDDIFKPYKRFHNGIEGRGVGLFLVKTHLEAIGGYINVESEPNKGTTFRIYFKELA